MSVPNIGDTRNRLGYAQDDPNSAERFILSGGINIEQPVANGDAGKLIGCLNFEPNYLGGMKSKGGFEPIDGRRQPSAVYYQAIKAVFAGLPTNRPTTIGQTITGNTSGAVALFLGYETIGSQQYVIMTRVNPSFIRAEWKAPADAAYTDTVQFQVGETLHTAAGNFCAVTSDALLSPSIDDISRAAYYISLARSLARSVITSVGTAGSSTGRALGVFDINGQTYAIRNKFDNSVSQMWRTTINGWSAVSLCFLVYFVNMTLDVKEGDTISNNAGTITATVQRVVVQFGSTGTGDAVGYIVAKSITGGSFTNGIVLKINGVVAGATPASNNAQLAFTLPPDTAANPTNYRFRRYNFSGSPTGERIYGVNGQGPAFEWDHVGGIITPIITGIGLTVANFNTISALEKPTCLAVQGDQLFLGYRGGALQHSGYQTPLDWTAVVGADTRQVGSDITNMLEDINGAMLIQTRNRNGMLYGDVNENFQLRWLDSSFGSYPDTAQRMNGAMFLTDEGVMVQDQTQQFGNFASISQSSDVNTLLRNLLRDGAGVVESTISRDGNLYRLYFDQGKMLSFCVEGNQEVGIGYCEYGIRVSNFWSGPSTVSTGTAGQVPPERILFCGSDGFVYQDDSGGSFGGSFIVGKLQTQFYRGQQNIANMKRYRQMFVDLLGADAYTNLRFSAEYDDGADYRTVEVPELVTRFLAGGVYETFSAYNQAFYGPSGKNVVRKQLNGQGVGISFIITFSSDISLPFNVQAIELVSALRIRRGLR